MRTLSSKDADWPAGLDDLTDPPSALCIDGQLPDLSQAVAIVGTRHADSFGMHFTRELAAELARAGCTILSGGAYGIDTAAHEGALEAGGATVAVLAGDVEAPNPPRNRAMFREIARSGALVAEVDGPPKHVPAAYLARNRLIAALARVVIVSQAPVKSGALSTAAHARRLGRPLLAVPHAPWEVRGAGCLTLLASGAQVCLRSSDVLSLAAPSQAQEARPKLGRTSKREALRGLDGDERQVAESLFGAALTADELCERSGMTAPRVQRAILMLLLSGVIQEVGCGRYARLTRL